VVEACKIGRDAAMDRMRWFESVRHG